MGCWRRLTLEPMCREGGGNCEPSRVKTGPGVTQRDLLTVNHFLLQGPTGLKGDKGPPGSVGANVSATPSAECGAWWRDLGVSGKLGIVMSLVWESDRPGLHPALPLTGWAIMSLCEPQFPHL